MSYHALIIATMCIDDSFKITNFLFHFLALFRWPSLSSLFINHPVTLPVMRIPRFAIIPAHPCTHHRE